MKYGKRLTFGMVNGLMGKDEKLRLTNLEWGVDFLRLTNLVKTSLDGQI